MRFVFEIRCGWKKGFDRDSFKPVNIGPSLNRSPIDLRFNYLHHSYWSYLHQLSYRTGAPPFFWVHGFITFLSYTTAAHPIPWSLVGSHWPIGEDHNCHGESGLVRWARCLGDPLGNGWCLVQHRYTHYIYMVPHIYIYILQIYHYISTHIYYYGYYGTWHTTWLIAYLHISLFVTLSFSTFTYTIVYSCLYTHVVYIYMY